MAGLLGEIFGTADVAKRKLKDVMANPLLSAQQFMGNVNDRARNLNEMTAAAALEGVDYGPASQRLGGLLADAYNPMGLTVFHGSPAKFNKFDPTKIGTGEGAQAYGYGHYVAESPKVAKGYQQAVSKDKFVTAKGLFDPSKLEHLNVKAEMRKGNLSKAIELAKKYSEPDSDYPETAAKAARDLAKLEEINASGGAQANPGSFYEIDLPDDQIARMLDYDKPLSQQPESVRQAIKEYELDYVPENLTGGRLIEEMNKAFTPEMVAQHMRTAGIPGIRYLDQSSRATPNITNQRLASLYAKHGGNAEAAVDEMMRSVYNTPKQKQEMRDAFLRQLATPKTSNFVVFPGNENLLNIKKRNEDPLGLFD